ncbi:hypothetical protein [Citrifermentans bremense]|uniref:hypothetical protein n=1 Tax=Citrifermentans bremense TaxID=60035 RepID=UPI00040DE7B5|nr:hypothetical protein [Citrifermentans bremense]
MITPLHLIMVLFAALVLCGCSRPETASWAKVRGSINLAMLREVMADSDRYALRGFDYRGNTETDGTR